MNALTHIGHLRGQAFWRAAETTLPPVTPCCPMCGRPKVVTGSVADIAFAVAEQEYGVDAAMLKAPGRTPRVSEARALMVWAMRSIGEGMSYGAIARLLGNRHRTTIMHLHQNAIALRLRDRGFAAACRAIAQDFAGQKDHDNGE